MPQGGTGLQVPHFFGEKMNNNDNDTNTPTTLNEMINLLESVQTDYTKFYVDGNSSAGTRIRKAMQQIKTTAHDVRQHVQTTKKNQ